MKTSLSKSYYNAQELSEFELKSLPEMPHNIRAKAKREGWKSRQRTGKGGGVEYAFTSLPKEVQEEIKEKQALKISNNKEALELSREIKRQWIAERKELPFSNKQKKTADSRLVVVNFILKMEETMSRKEAIARFCELSKTDGLPEDITKHLHQALAKRRQKGVGFRTVAGWLADAKRCASPADRLATFAPVGFGKGGKSLVEYNWIVDFLSHYQVFNGVSINEAFKNFAKVRGAKGLDVPSISTVRRVLSQIPKHVLERGRRTGASMSALKTYQKRDWSTLENNDVWVGDGHSLKMKVAHPEHGRPFTPELTLIMDAPSRYIVGWSLAYSENTFAVADALRHAMVQNGIPSIYYSDNGGGQKNKVLDDDLTGIFSRLGIHHETSIPGNPQGRGIIERVMKTLAHGIARQFPTYHGPNADPDTVRKVATATQSLAKAQAEGKTALTVKQKWAEGKLPRWVDLLDAIEKAVIAYNQTHKHRELGGVTPLMMRQHIFNQMDLENFYPLTDFEAREMFRPAFKRIVQRGWITVFKQNYWHRVLEDYDSQEVLVLVDQHDPSAVLVRHLDGKLICEAKLNGNKHAAFSESLVERSRRQRAERRLQKLAEEKIKAEAELHPVIEAEAYEVLDTLVLATPALVKEEEEIVLFAVDKK